MFKKYLILSLTIGLILALLGFIGMILNIEFLAIFTGPFFLAMCLISWLSIGKYFHAPESCLDIYLKIGIPKSFYFEMNIILLVVSNIIVGFILGIIIIYLIKLIKYLKKKNI